MKASRERTLLLLGPSGAGKAATIGSMLFKYGGIDTETMERFQREGISTNQQVGKDLVNPTFFTPNYHVTISSDGASTTDTAIVVFTADNQPTHVKSELANARKKAKHAVVVVNKMDETGWSENAFRQIAEIVEAEDENTPVVPISAHHSDNVVERSLSSPWFKGMTLLEALELSFSN